MENSHYAMAAVFGFLGATLPIVTKFVIDFLLMVRKGKMDELSTAWDEAVKIRQDLSAQISELRQSLIRLHEANNRYVRENADLSARITILTTENVDLKARVSVLADENDKLKARLQELETEIKLITPKTA